MMAAVCSFDTVHSAVDTVMQVMQCGIPIARIGTYQKFYEKSGFFTVSSKIFCIDIILIFCAMRIH